jgi:peptidylprolyl isomerase
MAARTYSLLPMSSRTLAICSVLAAGVIAGCGSSSNNSDTAHIQLPPSSSQTLTYSATSTTTTSTATTPAVTTPTSGPLSTEPKITAPSGAAPTTLATTDLIKGTGAVAAVGDTVTVNYVGALYSNAKVFDASWTRKQPYTLPGPLGTAPVITGWNKGLVGMRVGGRRELIIPPALGYGASGSGATIPPNATLIFIVDMLSVTPPSGSTGASG